MDELQLSETESRYFSDLFVCCDTEGTGKVSADKAAELFRSGNVPDAALEEILELCGSDGAYIGRKQFYAVLKLIAAHQSNVEPGLGVLSVPAELPLPRFNWPVDERAGSPAASSTASDSPTPTNSVQERSWAGNWLVCEEQRQLLGTEEESSDRHSSDDDADGLTAELFTITSEQREYYGAQFRSLQPDASGQLAGHVARTFFERSRLPVAELRKIWQLADVTRDGALSLDEFNVAMHLVVLRRNRIPIPHSLPPQLALPALSQPAASGASPATVDRTDRTKDNWTKFVDSPTSSIASPGPKPVNFDFQKAAVEQNPRILHPVPLRLTPEVAADEPEHRPDDIRPIQRPQPKKVAQSRGAIPPPPLQPPQPVSDELPRKSPPPPPPPRPLRSHGRSSSLDLNRLARAAPAPPAVPPRLSPRLARRLVGQRSEGEEPLPDTTDQPDANDQPDATNQPDADAFADFRQFELARSPEKYENVSGVFPGDVYEAERTRLFAQFAHADVGADGAEAPRKHGAFEVYRKPKESPPGALAEEQAVAAGAVGTATAADKWHAFRQLKEQNTVLLRLCQELSQELADVREERTRLRLRWDLAQPKQPAASAPAAPPTTAVD